MVINLLHRSAACKVLQQACPSRDLIYPPCGPNEVETSLSCPELTRLRSTEEQRNASQAQPLPSHMPIPCGQMLNERFLEAGIF